MPWRRQVPVIHSNARAVWHSPADGKRHSRCFDGNRNGAGGCPADLDQFAILTQCDKISQGALVGGKVHHARHHHAGVRLEPS